MKLFEKWLDNTKLKMENTLRDDMRAAYKAGMLAAAEIAEAVKDWQGVKDTTSEFLPAAIGREIRKATES